MRTLAARFSIAVAAIAVVAASLMLVARARADGASSSQGAPGMRVYRDPATGELTPPPADTGRAVEPEAQEPSPPPIVLEPNPAGGVKARLGEAYEHSMRATTDASGKTRVDCERGAASGKE